MNIRKILGASLIFVGVGLILVILSMILQLVSILVTDSAGEIVELINIIYSFLQIPLFFALYLIAGMRAVKTHKLDVVEAGLVAAFSYLVVALINLFLSFMLNFLVVSGILPGSAGFISGEAVLTSALFGDTAGISGLGISSICGFAMIIMGAMINFVIGGIGGIMASKSS